MSSTYFAASAGFRWSEHRPDGAAHPRTHRSGSARRWSRLVRRSRRPTTR